MWKAGRVSLIESTKHAKVPVAERKVKVTSMTSILVGVVQVSNMIRRSYPCESPVSISEYGQYFSIMSSLDRQYNFLLPSFVNTNC